MLPLPYIDAANNRLRKLFVNDHLIGDKYFDMVARTITKCYQDALKDIRNDISKVYEKFGDSVTYSELHQYNRLAKLEQQIEAKLKEVGVDVNKQIRQSIKETFASTYYNTGYATETMSGMKLGFGELDSKVVDAAIYNPYDKIKWNIRVVQNIAHANQKIRESLTTGLIQGSGYAKIAKSVNEYLGKNAYEMLRIMRTEGHRAQQAARIVAIDKVNSASKRTGMKVKKVWLATLDMRTREDHREMDGKEADEDGIFHLPDGSKTEAPGHSGVAEQDIHCRCDVIIQIADLPYGTRYDQLGKELTKNKTWKEWAQERGIKFKPYGGVVANIDKALDKDLPLEYVPCKTIKEAEQWAVKNLGFKEAKYTNLTAGNFTNEALLAAKQQGIKMPDAITVDGSRFVGKKEHYGTPAKFCLYRNGKTEIVINTYHYQNPEKRIKELIQEYKNKWCSTDHKYGDYFHELGHYMHLLKVGDKKYCDLKYYSAAKMEEIKDKLSAYGGYSSHELVAETFAAINTGKTVHPDIMKMYNDILTK